MGDSLYESSSRAASSVASTSQAPGGVGQTVQNISNSVSNNSIFGFFNFDFSPILSAVNYFVLAWIIVHSVLLLLEFYLHFFKFAAMDEFLENQETGRKKFFESWGMWGEYLFTLFFYALYQYFHDVPVVGFLLGIGTIGFFIYTFFVKALPKTPLLDVFQGKDSSLVGRGVKQLLNLRAKISPPAKKNSSGHNGKDGKDGKDAKADTGPSVIGGVIGGLTSIVTDSVAEIASIPGGAPAKTSTSAPEKK